MLVMIGSMVDDEWWMMSGGDECGDLVIVQCWL